MQATKYRDLVVLLILLDEVELRSRELAKRFPELRSIAEAISDAAGLCDLAMTVVSKFDMRNPGETACTLGGS